jgi:hypothetical protein
MDGAINMSTVLFMGGLFNIVDPVFQFPLYIWSWALLIIAAGVSWAFWYYRGWKPYEPLHGLYYAMRNISYVSFIFDSNLVGELVAERDAKCIFNYSDDEYEIDVPYVNHPLVGIITRWVYPRIFYYPTKYLDIPPLQALYFRLMNSNKDVEIARLLENGGKWERSTSVVCSGVPLDIVVDMDNWTVKSSRQHKAIVRSAIAWNLGNPDDQIHSYRKYQAYLMSGKIIVPPELHLDIIIPWQRIDAAFPLELEENEWGGKVRQMAADEENEESDAMNKLAIFLLVGGLVFALVLLLVRFAALH